MSFDDEYNYSALAVDLIPFATTERIGMYQQATSKIEGRWSESLHRLLIVNFRQDFYKQLIRFKPDIIFISLSIAKTRYVGINSCSDVLFKLL